MNCKKGSITVIDFVKTCLNSGQDPFRTSEGRTRKPHGHWCTCRIHGIGKCSSIPKSKLTYFPSIFY